MLARHCSVALMKHGQPIARASALHHTDVAWQCGADKVQRPPPARLLRERRGAAIAPVGASEEGEGGNEDAGEAP